MPEIVHFGAAFAPSQDKKDRFFSTTPTSLGWALAPLVSEIASGKITGVSYDPEIYDPLRLSETVFTDFAERIRNQRTTLLFISSTYDSHYNAIRLATTAREVNPDITIVYGGPHVNEVCNSHVVEAMPQVYPFNEDESPFDILVEGDGEMAIKQIVLDLRDLRSRDRLLEYISSDGMSRYEALIGHTRLHIRTKNNEEPIIIQSSGQVMPISQFGFLPRDMFGKDLDRYGFSCFTEIDAKGEIRLLPSTSTLLHRGCKHFCIFCSEAGGFNQRSTQHIIRELQMLKEKGYKGVFFDDSTLGDHEGLDDLLLRMKELGLQYGSLNRFDKLQDPEFVRKLREAGFVYQYCSIEQFDDRVLRNNGKGQNIEDIRRGIKNLEMAGISLGVSLLFGMRSETEQTIRDTLEFVSQQVDRGVIVAVSTSLFSFHPKTPQTLLTVEGKAMHHILRYNQPPPNQGQPWDSFEEGQWYHPSWVKEDRVELVRRMANELVGKKLVRNMNKDGSASANI